MTLNDPIYSDSSYHVENQCKAKKENPDILRSNQKHLATVSLVSKDNDMIELD